ncbi:hypothetical protein SeLEV6574_g07514 [Synchytrium endobioticum]|uniref:RING-type E3 ubiquitin transferase n=1 Tax=Synchytrium endobioticum TaxID=286115 RepID=A0A507CLD9_9FUNG|nr:hypothetical protein SeLEV6574_g07514 [Synchytrium endobioticum]
MSSSPNDNQAENEPRTSTPSSTSTSRSQPHPTCTTTHSSPEAHNHSNHQHVHDESELHDHHDDDDDDDNDNDAASDEDGGNFWCHSCEHAITPLMDTGTPTCPSCHSDFVEEIDNDDDHPRGYDPHANDEDEPVSPIDPAAVSQELARVLQLFLQQLVGNNATISVQTRPAREGEEHGVVITTAAATEPDESTTNTNQDETGNPTAAITTNESSPLPAQHQPSQQQEDTTSRHRGGATEGTQPETINLTQLLQALLEAPTEGQPNPLAHILNMVGNPGDYVFSQNGLDDIVTRLMEQHAAGSSPPPADDSTIKSLPLVSLDQKQVDEQADCIICQDQFKIGESAKLLPCKHFFHAECIESWLKVNGTCPTCRHSLIAT